MSQDTETSSYHWFSARLLTVFDHAHDAAENPNWYDGLCTAVERFFLPRSANGGLVSDLAEASAL